MLCPTALLKMDESIVNVLNLTSLHYNSAVQVTKQVFVYPLTIKKLLLTIYIKLIC